MKGDTLMSHAIDMGWFVLKKYYAKSDAVPAYAAALLLDPTKRMAYLTQNWASEWISGILKSVEELWHDEYQKSEQASVRSEAADIAPDIPRKLSRFEELRNRLQVTQTQDEDDLAAFINEPAIKLPKGVTPLQWWCREEQRMRYPQLSRMAIDMLSIPPMSDEVERVFSGARRTISWERARISAAKVEQVECVGNWVRNGHIRSNDEVLAIDLQEDFMEIDEMIDSQPDFSGGSDSDISYG
jgi:hypothetical protein